MAQYVYTMNRVGKIVPPKRVILRDISLSFFPGAKIGVLGLNGSGKSTLLRIMAGVDKDFEGEARPQPGIKIGFLQQEPELDPTKDVRGNVEVAVAHIKDALAKLEAVYAAYAEPDADFDKIAAEQAKLEAIIQATDGHNLASSRWPPTRCACPRGTPTSRRSRAASGVAWRCASCCSRSPTCCCSTSPPTTSTRSRCAGSSISSNSTRARSSP